MLKLFNTLTREKEIFQPMQANKVSLYVCGVTVYDHCHLGHARTYLSADILNRYLQFSGYDVQYVRNITDIDDKIIKRAAENNEPIEALTARTIASMHEDFAALNLVVPQDEPRATAYIPKMVQLIEKLISKSHAYVASNGDVYFDVRSFPQYGCLSHHAIDDLESGVRVEVTEAKRDPLDFVLWKLAKANEPSWSSPWGAGRPGWHIECSAMAMDLLGEQFDIHGGGRDLIFPHHENEIAQSQAVTAKPFANYWFHGGFLQVNEEKMSKSLGNFTTIKQALADHPAEVLRYVLIASHYRSPISYSNDALTQGKQALSRFYTALRYLPDADATPDASFIAQFKAAMDDDLNTPVALSVMFELAHEIQRVRDHDLSRAAVLGQTLKTLGGVLGILQQNPDAFFQASATVDVQQIEGLIAARQTARQSKNWAEADRIRQQLTAMGITIEDGAQGTTWKVIG